MLGCVVEAHGPWFKSCCWFNSLIYLVLVVASVVSALSTCLLYALTGAYLNTIKRTVKYLCPADIIPPYIDLLRSKDEPVCKIMGTRVSDQRKSK
ncbi:hypothetical protein AAG906_034234 [Vitis piasezkii]